MGAMFGATLAEAGNEVVLIDTNAAHVAAINGKGLKLSGVGGERVVRLPAHVDAAGLGEFALVLVTVDANNTANAAPNVAALMGADGVALSLQNGIGNVEALVAHLGEGRVLAGVSHHSAAYLGPGEVAFTHSKMLWLGELDGQKTPRVAAIVAAFEAAGHPVTLVDDPLGWIWSKFVLNCAGNALCASTGLRAGDIARTPELDALQDRIIDEALALVDAKGITLPEPDIRRTIKNMFFAKYNKPSMLQHVEGGRRTEIDALNGALVREAHALGLRVPYNEAVTAIIKGIERAALRRAEPVAPDYDALEREARAEAQARGMV
jgi:2-dehydropantoate 2-reductase